MIALTTPHAPRARRAAAPGARRALTTAVPVMLFTLFAVASLTSWMDTGKVTGLILALQEAVLVALFLVRREARTISRRPVDWVVAVVGTFGGLLLRPHGDAVAGLDEVWAGAQAVAAVLSIACLLGLGRSFGVVAANRGVRTGGPYAVVRHPIYASYLLAYATFLLGAASAWNLLVLVVVFVAQLRRVAAEEAVLGTDAAYAAYAERVRWRLVPGLY